MVATRKPDNIICEEISSSTVSPEEMQVFNAIVDFGLKDPELMPFKKHIKKYAYVGSRATCVPAPTDTDKDIIIYTDDCHAMVMASHIHGFTIGGSLIKNKMHLTQKPDFISIRKGELNLIITEKIEHFNNFILASNIAKKLNVLLKEDRIALFHAIMFGESCGFIGTIEVINCGETPVQVCGDVMKV